MLISLECIEDNINDIDSIVNCYNISSEDIIESNALIQKYSLMISNSYAHSTAIKPYFRKVLNKSIQSEHGDVYYRLVISDNTINYGQYENVQTILRLISEINRLVAYKNSNKSRIIGSYFSRKFTPVIETLLIDKLYTNNYETFDKYEEFRVAHLELHDKLVKNKCLADVLKLKGSSFKVITIDVGELLCDKVSNENDLEMILDRIIADILRMYAIIALYKTHSNLEEVLDIEEIDGVVYYSLKGKDNYKDILINYMDTLRIYNELGGKLND